MTYSNSDLLNRFLSGKTTGRCNRMAIEEHGDWTFLWGYGHALYAARHQEDGMLFVYDGWNGYSPTTSTHLNALKSKAKSRYGEPRNDGDQLQLVVTGEESELTESPPQGHEYVLVEDADPRTSYGQLNAIGRPELSHVDGKHLNSPGGSSSGSMYE